MKIKGPMNPIEWKGKLNYSSDDVNSKVMELTIDTNE